MGRSEVRLLPRSSAAGLHRSPTMRAAPSRSGTAGWGIAGGALKLATSIPASPKSHGKGGMASLEPKANSAGLLASSSAVIS